MRYHRTFGLDAEQLDELEARIEDILPDPWDKGTGRPKSLSLREAIMVTLLYKRQNMIEEVIADLFGVSQGTVSEIIAEFTPLIAQATEEFRPDAEEAKQTTRGRLALVDGTLWPCWSWERAPEMWAGKYKTTGHGSLIIGDQFGSIIFVSDPVGLGNTIRDGDLRFRSSVGWSGGDVVLVGQSAENLFPADPVLGEVDRLRRRGVSLGRCVLAEGTVRPGSVVVPQVLGQHLAQMVLIDDQQPVEELASQGAYDSLADGVRFGRLRRAGQNPDAFRLEHGVERIGELACAIPDQELD